MLNAQPHLCMMGCIQNHVGAVSQGEARRGGGGGGGEARGRAWLHGLQEGAGLQVFLIETGPPGPYSDLLHSACRGRPGAAPEWAESGLSRSHSPFAAPPSASQLLRLLFCSPIIFILVSVSLLLFLSFPFSGLWEGREVRWCVPYAMLYKSHVYILF